MTKDLLSIAFLLLIPTTSSTLGDWNADLIAVGSLSGTAKDATSEAIELEEGTPTNQIGGFSAIEYAGQDNLFWVLADRGPADGAASYPCRTHLISLEPNLETKTITPKVIKSVFLKDRSGETLLGALTSVPKERHERGYALDPEGIRLLPDGDFLISDEYGPGIDRFSRDGLRKQTYTLPQWMALTREQSLATATEGTMPNRGLEGLALDSTGRFLVGAMQGPLIQDSYPKKEKRFGNHARLIQLDLTQESKQFHGMKQFLYPLTRIETGISEILAVDSSRYLVLERDSKKGKDAVIKAIYLIDISGSSDVANIEKIPSGELPETIRPVSKSLAINLMSPNYGFDGASAPEKPEGIAWGKPLEDGRRTLWVCFDNDFQSNVDSLFFLFAINEQEIKR